MQSPSSRSCAALVVVTVLAAGCDKPPPLTPKAAESTLVGGYWVGVGEYTQVHDGSVASSGVILRFYADGRVDSWSRLGPDKPGTYRVVENDVVEFKGGMVVTGEEGFRVDVKMLSKDNIELIAPGLRMRLKRTDTPTLPAPTGSQQP